MNHITKCTILREEVNDKLLQLPRSRESICLSKLRRERDMNDIPTLMDMLERVNTLWVKYQRERFYTVIDCFLEIK